MYVKNGNNSRIASVDVQTGCRTLRTSYNHIVAGTCTSQDVTYTSTYGGLLSKQVGIEIF